MIADATYWRARSVTTWSNRRYIIDEFKSRPYEPNRLLTTNDAYTNLFRRRPRHDCYPLTRVAALSRARRRSAVVGSTRPRPLRRVGERTTILVSLLYWLHGFTGGSSSQSEILADRHEEASKRQPPLVTLVRAFFLWWLWKILGRATARREGRMDAPRIELYDTFKGGLWIIKKFFALFCFSFLFFRTSNETHPCFLLAISGKAR